MDVQVCPHCHTQVVFTADGICPSCRTSVRSPLNVVAQPRGDSDSPFKARNAAVGAAESQNPYQSPVSFPEPPPPPALGTPHGHGLGWLLFSFRGRIPRSVFWITSILSTILFYFVIVVVAVIAGDAVPDVALAIVIVPLYVAMVWVSLAVTVKRWHDLDKSGWWILIGFLPIIGPIWQFVETGCLRGTVGPNAYGDDPTNDHAAQNYLPHALADRMSDARAVELDGSTATDADLAGLVGNTRIEELRLGGTAVTDVGLEVVGRLRTLHFLDLSLTRVSDFGLTQLLDLPDLTTLWLGGTRITDAGLAQLAQLPALSELHITNTEVTRNAVRQFQERCPQCVVRT